MDLRFTAEEETFRVQVRTFLDQNLTEDLRRAGRSMTSVYSDYAEAMAWQRILYAKGWLAPAWPVEYGGTGWTLTQRYIWQCELARARPPGLSPMGLAMLGPALIGHGTEAQKRTLLPRILDGSDFWCQGYSEPRAGSDLAALDTRAERHGDEYRVTGQKIWTTHAHYANRMFCLVRTARMDRPQQGVTFLLLDMDAPGVSVEPIRFVSGEAVQSQVFFDDIRVPVQNVVGKENEGWTVTKYLLEFERGGGAAAPGLLSAIGRHRDLAAEVGADPAVLQRLAALETEVHALEMLELRILAETERRGSPGPAASALKIRGTELSQRISEVAVDLAGLYGLPYVPDGKGVGSNVADIGPSAHRTAVPFYLNNRAATIYAGTNEIQRNIIAKAVLGL